MRIYSGGAPMYSLVHGWLWAGGSGDRFLECHSWFCWGGLWPPPLGWTGGTDFSGLLGTWTPVPVCVRSSWLPGVLRDYCFWPSGGSHSLGAGAPWMALYHYPLGWVHGCSRSQVLLCYVGVVGCSGNPCSYIPAAGIGPAFSYIL